MSKEDKPDAWMPQYGFGSRRNPRDSDRRIEINTSELACYESHLSCEEAGLLFRLLMREAAGELVEVPRGRELLRVWEARDNYRRIAGSFHRPPLPFSTRLQVYERDGKACRYCGSPLTWSEYQCDHIVPTSKGGGDHLDNLTASCQPCNRSKSAKLLEEWQR